MEQELAAERKRRIAAERKLDDMMRELGLEQAMWKYVDERDEKKMGLQHAVELIEEILHDPKKLHDNIKMTLPQFEEMYDQFSKYAKEVGELPQCSDTEFGQGNVCIVTLRHILFLALAFLTSGLTEARFGSHFSISQPTISRYVKYVRKFLPRFCASPPTYSQAIKDCKTVKELKEWIPNLTLYGDGTHSFIDKPQDCELEQQYFSPYKQHHTVVEEIFTNSNREILYIAETYRGPEHELTIFRAMKPDWGKWFAAMKSSKTPDNEKTNFFLDGAYTGGDDDYPGCNIITPHKKPPKGQLTKEQIAFNKWQRAERVLIENVIGEAKEYASLRNQFQGNDEDHNELMQAIATLVNYNRLWDKVRDKPTARFKKLKKLYGFK